MARARDSIVYCPYCGAENFYDAERQKQPRCWQENCKREFPVPPRIQIEKHLVMLNHDARLYPHHISGAPTYDFSSPVAEVTRHPTNPNVWGLKNTSDSKWVCTLAYRTVRDVEPGKNVPLGRGVKIQFGKVEGEILV
jgi:hypothetical protein